MRRALLICLVMSFVMSGCFAWRASSARAQYRCTTLALQELRTGRTWYGMRYLEAAQLAYFTGDCKPQLGGLRIKKERPESRS